MQALMIVVHWLEHLIEKLCSDLDWQDVDKEARITDMGGYATPAPADGRDVTGGPTS